MTEEEVQPDLVDNKQYSVDEATADAEFLRFIDAMDIDLATGHMSRQDKDDLIRNKRKFVRAVMMGKLVVNDAGEPVLTTVDGKTFTFREPMGSDMKAIESVSGREGGEITQTFKYLGSLTGTSAGAFSSMKKRDFVVCEAILGFFST